MRIKLKRHYERTNGRTDERTDERTLLTLESLRDWKLTFFTHPNIKIGKNGNAPIHRRGFHVFFKNSWPSFTHLRPDIMALVIWFIMLSFILLWFIWCQTYFWTLKCDHKCVTRNLSKFFTLRRVNDTNYTFSAASFWDVFPKWRLMR